ncbi:hypothetical protein [Bacillus sp. BHET2]|nr:hypothetical protein [Bacillus sp. BHET2]
MTEDRDHLEELYELYFHADSVVESGRNSIVRKKELLKKVALLSWVSE